MGGGAPAEFTTAVILSSSAGQMSGQLVKPKYTRLHFPSSSFSVNGAPVCDVRVKGPPILGRPYCVAARSFSISQDGQREAKRGKGGGDASFLDVLCLFVAKVDDKTHERGDEERG